MRETEGERGRKTERKRASKREGESQRAAVSLSGKDLAD